MTANNKQVGGSHYKSKMECWDYILSNDLGYLEGTATRPRLDVFAITKLPPVT